MLLLVEKTARMAPGDAERAAVRVWSKLYSDASAVVHGGSCTHAEAVRMFDASVAAIRQVFVALPHRAPQIRALALFGQPTAEQASGTPPGVRRPRGCSPGTGPPSCPTPSSPPGARY